ncbi:heme-binding domain-containing protein [Reichenbachiella agarivorans]|uniref:Heme-binding domain-containing protein n=1 Tax=Reichenbachiella agarivorans TaxID=2979464 RepID=A0ABY6CME0_9BACT|nr:heme-binding domain-containing protein [Reichenbachiella agarivorans]UXP31687.1 heme-binding domain-containing protein [Reichenbachiella agarivorans]
MINKKNISIAVLAFLVVIQLFGIDREVPTTTLEQDFISVMQPPENIAKIIKTACYDCHSYQTEYPWYTHVAPLSWWIGTHIEDGRKHLNFSIWSTYDEKKALHKLEELYEEVEEGEMPLTSYTLAHSDADLSPSDVEQLVSWVKSIPGVLEQE